MSTTRRIAALLMGATLTVTTLSATADQAGAAGRGKPRPHAGISRVQLLSFNDFHGNLDAPSGSGGRVVTDHRSDASGAAVDVTTDAGGVEYLATHLAKARAGQRDSFTVAAGDLVGASPLLSAAFHDEPSVEALNSLHLDASAVGNHEFDEGYRELQRLQYGGCIDDGAGAGNQNSCADHVFPGADFSYLAANVKYTGSKRTVLPPYTIRELSGGGKIAFIGMTLKETPSIVSAAGIKGLDFTDEVSTANALVPELRRKGVNAIVVLVHQGGSPSPQTWTDPATGRTSTVNPTYDYTCGKGGSLAPTSPILDISSRLDPAIDMVVSGHTHQPYVCSVADPAGQHRLVTSASSFGLLYTDTRLSYDPRRNDIVRASVSGSTMVVSRDVPKDAEQGRLIARYRELVTPIASRVVGHVNADVTRNPNAAGESALGDLIADAQLADPSTVTGGRAPVIAFMNPGGIRADLTASASPYGEPTGDVTFDEAFTVQPFNNYLVSLDLTGQQIYDLLAQQVSEANANQPKVLQVSQGFSYTLTATGAADGSVRLNGTPIDKGATYRVVTNNFLADGGDGFPAFAAGKDRYIGGLDIDAFSAYLPKHSPYTPAAPSRITKG